METLEEILKARLQINWDMINDLWQSKWRCDENGDKEGAKKYLKWIEQTKVVAEELENTLEMYNGQKIENK